MELSELRVFLKVATERSFSRAAMKLHRTQPAVSQAVRRLEESVGERLFDRATKDASLTDAGRLLRAAPLATFTKRTGVLTVEVEEGASRLAARLTGAGLIVREDGHFVLVQLDDERPYDLVRDAAAELGLALTRMEQRRHRLEDLFREPAEVLSGLPGDVTRADGAAAGTGREGRP